MTVNKNQTLPRDGADAANFCLATKTFQVDYTVIEINLPSGDDQPRPAPAAKLVQTGSGWMKQGVPLRFTRLFDSAAVTLEAGDGFPVN
jgi:hypothetical protein